MGISDWAPLVGSLVSGALVGARIGHKRRQSAARAAPSPLRTLAWDLVHRAVGVSRAVRVRQALVERACETAASPPPAASRQEAGRPTRELPPDRGPVVTPQPMRIADAPPVKSPRTPSPVASSE